MLERERGRRRNVESNRQQRHNVYKNNIKGDWQWNMNAHALFHQYRNQIRLAVQKRVSCGFQSAENRVIMQSTALAVDKQWIFEQNSDWKRRAHITRAVFLSTILVGPNVCGIVAWHDWDLFVCVHGKWESGVKHDFLLVNIIFDQKGHYDGAASVPGPKQSEHAHKNGDWLCWIPPEFQFILWKFTAHADTYVSFVYMQIFIHILRPFFAFDAKHRTSSKAKSLSRKWRTQWITQWRKGLLCGSDCVSETGSKKCDGEEKRAATTRQTECVRGCTHRKSRREPV